MRHAALILFLFALVPAAAHGQGIDPRAIEVWAGYAAWSGDEVDSVDPGVQGGVSILAETAPHFAFGAEAYIGRFEQGGIGITEVGLNGLGRLSLGPRSGLHVYLQGRIGWTRLSYETLSQNGLAVGPEIGIEMPVGSGLRLVLAGGGTWRSYENLQVAGSTFIGDGGASGVQYTARVGIAFDEIL